MEVYSGIDLVEIHRFQQLNPAIRKRFFERVFTKKELAYINNLDQKAAGMFAAKEACAKALGCGIGPIRWVDIEITHTDENQPQICLHGRAQQLTRVRKITSWSVSISHTKDTAAAVVVAVAADS